MRRKQFIWKTAKGLMCCFTTAHVSPEYSRTDMTWCKVSSRTQSTAVQKCQHYWVHNAAETQKNTSIQPRNSLA